MLKNRKDICVYVRQDHESLLALLHDLISAKKIEQKTQIFHEFRLQLMTHSKAEEEVFYKALKKMKFNRVQILENIEEHHILEVLITELSKLSIDHERWHAKLELMRNILEKHFKQEERDIFPLAHLKFSIPELKKLGDQFARSKDRWLDLYTDVIESHLNFPHAAREVIFEFHKGLV